jgi:hypothetical protein
MERGFLISREIQLPGKREFKCHFPGIPGIPGNRFYFITVGKDIKPKIA